MVGRPGGRGCSGREEDHRFGPAARRETRVPRIGRRGASGCFRVLPAVESKAPAGRSRWAPTKKARDSGGDETQGGSRLRSHPRGLPVGGRTQTGRSFTRRPSGRMRATYRRWAAPKATRDFRAGKFPDRKKFDTENIPTKKIFLPSKCPRFFMERYRILRTRRRGDRGEGRIAPRLRVSSC